jgi:hypothetical protein
VSRVIVKSKKKLLVILGAGSSAPCGMPTVQKIGCNMKKWSEGLLTTGPGPNYFNQLWDLASRLSDADGLGRECSLKPNCERILGDMIVLANWDRPAPWGNTLRMAVHDGRLLTSLNPDEKWMGPLIVMRLSFFPRLA